MSIVYENTGLFCRALRFHRVFHPLRGLFNLQPQFIRRLILYFLNLFERPRFNNTCQYLQKYPSEIPQPVNSEKAHFKNQSMPIEVVYESPQVYHSHRYTLHRILSRLTASPVSVCTISASTQQPLYNQPASNIISAKFMQFLSLIINTISNPWQQHKIQ